MSSTRISRLTVVVHDPLAVDVTLKQKYSPAKFRVESARESLTQGDNGDRYTVVLQGPALTPKGRPHARNRGEAEYGDGWSCRPLDQLPLAITSVLLGRDGLAAWAPEGTGR